MKPASNKQPPPPPSSPTYPKTAGYYTIWQSKSSPLNQPTPPNSLQLGLGTSIGRNLLIHAVNLGAESPRRLRALELEAVHLVSYTVSNTVTRKNLRGSQKLILNRKRLNIQIDILHLLVAVELVALSNVIQQLQQRPLDPRVVRRHLERSLVLGRNVLLEDLAGIRSKVHRVDTEHSHQARLLGLAVHKGHGEEVAAAEVDVLDALGGNVLALRELEHVLLAVDDLEAAHAVHLDDVAGVEPPVGLDRLGRLLGVAVVLLEDDGTAHEQLAAGVGLVLNGVLVVGDGLDAELDRGARGADVAGGEIAGHLDGTDGVGLGHAETLNEVVAKGGAEELVDVGVELGGTADHGASARETNTLEDLGGPDLVVEEVLVGGLARRKLHAGLLGLNDTAREGTLEALLLNRGGLDGRVDAVEETGHRHETSWAQELNILHKLGDVTVEVTDAGAFSESSLVSHATIDMRKGKIRQMDVASRDALVGTSSRDTGNTVGVGDKDTLGVTSGTRGVVDGQNILGLGRAHWAAGAGTQRLHALHGEDLKANLGGRSVQERQLGVAGHLTGIEGVQGDDELEAGHAGRKLQESGDVRERADDGSQLAVVDDVLGRLGSESLVERNGPQGLREQSQLGDLPLGAVLGPETDSILLVSRDANPLVQLNNASTKVLPALSNLGICRPDKLVLPCLGDRVPGSVAQASVSGDPRDGSFEEIVDGANGGVEGLEKRAVLEAPMAVDGSPVGALGAGDGEGVGSARRGWLGDGVDVSRRILLAGSHGREVFRRNSKRASLFVPVVEGGEGRTASSRCDPHEQRQETAIRQNTQVAARGRLASPVVGGWRNGFE